jgi:hypothetical protein
MKKLQTILLITVLMFSINIKSAHALFGMGDIVFDPAAFGQFIVSQGTRVAQFGTEISTTVSSGVSAVQQTVSTINQTILRPLQDAMMLVSIINSSTKIKNLVLGSTSGQVSLLIQNPQRYIQQQGVESMKLNVNYVSKADGVYSNSIMDAVISKARTNSDTEGQLASLSKSSIPKTIQNDLCEDSKLESVAMNDVSNTMDVPTLEAVRARKVEIHNKLCVGDPNTDKALAQALTTAGDQTGAGGWGRFLAVTGGDNQYTKTNQALNVIEAQKVQREAAEAADLARGNGVVSKTECLRKSYDAKTGLDVCVEKSITNSGYQLSESFKSAINAPLDVLKNSYGTGGSFSSILGSVASIIGSVNSISNSINSLQGTANSLTSSISGLTGGDPSLQININGKIPLTSSNGGNGTYTVGSSNGSPTGNTSGVGITNNSQMYTQPTYTNTTTNTTASYTQDLVANPVAKDSLLKPIKKQLNLHLQTLTTLENSDINYLSEIGNYIIALNGVPGCYQQLISSFPKETLTAVYYFPETTFPSIANDERIVSALNYYTTKKTATDKLKSDIITEKNTIGLTRELVTQTLNNVTTSNSTEEIAFLFDAYNSKVENNNWPSSTSGISREGEVMSYKSMIVEETRDYTGVAGAESFNGKLTVLKNTCAAIRAEEQAKRDASRQARQDAINNGSVNQGGGGE